MNNTEKKELRKTFVFDEATQKKVDLIRNKFESDYGGGLSEGQVIRKIISDYHKTFKKTKK